MNDAKQDYADYAKAIRQGNFDACVAIEQRHGLYGYPPDLVSIGLSAIANGKDAHEAIEQHIYGGENE